MNEMKKAFEEKRYVDVLALQQEFWNSYVAEIFQVDKNGLEFVVEQIDYNNIYEEFILSLDVAGITITLDHNDGAMCSVYEFEELEPQTAKEIIRVLKEANFDVTNLENALE